MDKPGLRRALRASFVAALSMACLSICPALTLARPSWTFRINGTSTVDLPARPIPCASADPRFLTAHYTNSLSSNPLEVRLPGRKDRDPRAKLIKPKLRIGIFVNRFKVSGPVQQTGTESWENPCPPGAPTTVSSCTGSGTSSLLPSNNLLTPGRASPRSKFLKIAILERKLSSRLTFPALSHHCNAFVTDIADEDVNGYQFRFKRFRASKLTRGKSGVLQFRDSGPIADPFYYGPLPPGPHSTLSYEITINW